MEILNCSGACIIINSSSVLPESIAGKIELLVYGILIPCIAVPGIFGNIACVTVFSQKTMRSPINTYLAGLGCFDFLTLFFALLLYPPMAYCEHLDVPLACSTFTYSSLVCYPLSLVSHFCSVWTCVALTIDRFLAVVFPLQKRVYSTASQSTKILLSIALVGSMYCIPTAFELRLDEFSKPRPTGFRLSKSYTLIYKAYGNLVVLLIVPWFIMIIFNTIVIFSMKSASKTRESIVPSCSSAASKCRKSITPSSVSSDYRSRGRTLTFFRSRSPINELSMDRERCITPTASEFEAVHVVSSPPSSNEAKNREDLIPTCTTFIGPHAYERERMNLSSACSSKQESFFRSSSIETKNEEIQIYPSTSTIYKELDSKETTMSLLNPAMKTKLEAPLQEYKERMSLSIPKAPRSCRERTPSILFSASEPGSSECSPLTPIPTETQSGKSYSLSESRITDSPTSSESRIGEWIAQRSLINRRRRTTNFRKSSEIKWTKIAFLVIVLFLACNLPAAINGYIQEAAILQYPMSKEDWGFILRRSMVFLGNFLVCFNSGANFVIYCILAVRFREKFLEITCMQKTRVRSKLSTTTPTLFVSGTGPVTRQRTEDKQLELTEPEHKPSIVNITSI